MTSGSATLVAPGITGVATHGGRYTLYNVYGNLFEVSSKYVPPIRPLGRGAYGFVCGAVNSETGEGVAIKKVGNAFDNRIDAKRTLREIKLLLHMDHENVISIRDIIRPPLVENFNDVYVVYEVMDTDLHQIIKSNQPLTDDHCRYFLYQLLRGLKYVHSANVLHRDLKPSNLFLNANCDLKIGDFGLARTTSETDLTEYVVTRWYRAPELLLNCSEYTGAIDIWSVGCILAEINTRQPLFPGQDYIHQLKIITELIGSPDESSLGFLRSDSARRFVRQLPQHPMQQFSSRFPTMSPGAVDLLSKMLVFDPSRRITGVAKPDQDHKLDQTSGFGPVPVSILKICERPDRESKKNPKLNKIRPRLDKTQPKPSKTRYKLKNWFRTLKTQPKYNKNVGTGPGQTRTALYFTVFVPIHLGTGPNQTVPTPNIFLHLVAKNLYYLRFCAVEEALCHPYLASLHDINEEPVCPWPFSFDFEQPSYTEVNIKELIWRESVRFNPDPTH